MNTILLYNILTCIKVVHIDSFLTLGCWKELQKLAHELSGAVCDMSMWDFTHDEHLPDMTFGLNVTLEAIFIAAILLAYLTIPSESLQTFGFPLVRDGPWCAFLCSRHAWSAERNLRNQQE